MSPKRTIYVREADQELWDRAETLAGHERDSLSGAISEALRAWVQRKEADRQGLERIEVVVSHGQFKRVQAFVGRWLIDPAADVQSKVAGAGSAVYGVAETQRGRLAIYVIDAGTGSLHDFDSFQAAARAGYPEDVLIQAGLARDRTRPPQTEELDI